MTFGDFKVEIRRGPAPDTARLAALTPLQRARLQADEKAVQIKIREAEADAAKAGSDAARRQALSVVAKLNAQVRASKLSVAAALDDGRKPKDPDATDFHALVPINDYPQKARWRVTNKETMSQLIEMTGASVTNKGEFSFSSDDWFMSNPS